MSILWILGVLGMGGLALLCYIGYRGYRGVHTLERLGIDLLQYQRSRESDNHAWIVLGKVRERMSARALRGLELIETLGEPDARLARITAILKDVRSTPLREISKPQVVLMLPKMVPCDKYGVSKPRLPERIEDFLNGWNEACLEAEHAVPHVLRTRYGRVVIHEITVF